jgi:uncharacterized protein (DUF2235 family)
LETIQPKTEDQQHARQLVLCCDGTNNNLTGYKKDTNVVKLCKLLSELPAANRVLFYDPGVGNPGELPGATYWDKLIRRSDRIAGLAFGKGVYENIAQGYAFLMKTYVPGDQIFLFGFSRGAFTARSISGLINQFGILRPEMESMIPTLLYTYFADRKGNEYKAIAEQTTSLFVDPSSRYVEIQFVGVWDTVASVGMPPFGAKFAATPTINKKRFIHVRHALALDEHRAQFRPRPYVENNGTGYVTERGTPATLDQRWFRGAHCNIGGGYTAGETQISDHAFAWLVSEAVNDGGLRLSVAGTPLATEATVLATLHGLSTGYPASPAFSVTSELYETPLWAVAGLNVRATERITIDSGATFDIVPAEHPSVSAALPIFPDGSIWQKPRPKVAIVVASVITFLLLATQGQALLRETYSNKFVADALLALSHIPAYLAASLDFAIWQLTWLMDPSSFKEGVARFASPRTAIMIDFFMIGAYSYVFAWFCVKAFAFAAGYRRAGEPIPLRLNQLGQALTLTVLADLAENVMTLIAITLANNTLADIAPLFGIFMSICAAAKFIGLLGVTTLCLFPKKSLHRSPLYSFTK